MAFTVAAAFTASSMHAIAQDLKRAQHSAQAPVAERSLAHLEKAFWACDYAATAHGLVDSEALSACIAVSQQLKVKKFDGDFGAMIAWWDQNKTREHEALAATYRDHGQQR